MHSRSPKAAFGLAAAGALFLLMAGCSAAGEGSQPPAAASAPAATATAVFTASPEQTATLAPTDTPAPSVEPLPDEGLLICNWLAPVETTAIGSKPDFDEAIRVAPDLEFNEMLAGYAGVQMESLGQPLRDAWFGAVTPDGIVVTADLSTVVGEVMDVCRAGGWEPG